MTVGLSNTALLDLPLPVEGYFDGTWGDLVNNALTNYLDIAIAGTSTFTGDGAVTLDNTAGDDSVSNITANSGQYAFIKVSGTLTTTKVITVGTVSSPAVSKSYIVDNAATGGTVTFKAYGQTGISVAVGEKCIVYFNGTDFVKVASSVADGVTSVSGTGTVNGITLTGTVTSTGSLTLGGTLSGVNLTSQVTGTLPIANGGTGTGSTTFANLTTNVTGTLPVLNGGTGTTTSTGTGNTVLSASPTFTGTPAAPTAATGTNTTQLATTAFVQNQIGAISAGVTSFSAGTTGLTPSTGTSGNVTLGGTLDVDNGGTGVTTSTGSGSVVLNTSPTLVTPVLGTPTSGNFSTGTFTWPTFNQNTTGNAATATTATTATTANSTPLLQTTNFSISEVSGKLVFKYGATTIASMDSSGNLITVANVTAYGTP